MQKHVSDLRISARLWLPSSRWPVYGEQLFAFRVPTGSIVFADEQLESQLFVARGAQIRALGRGTWHTMRGISECGPAKIWRIRYERSMFRYGDPVCFLDTFDGEWRRTTIVRDSLVEGKRFVYEG